MPHRNRLDPSEQQEFREVTPTYSFNYDEEFCRGSSTFGGVHDTSQPLGIDFLGYEGRILAFPINLLFLATLLVGPLITVVGRASKDVSGEPRMPGFFVNILGCLESKALSALG